MQVLQEEGCPFFDHNRPPFVSVDLTYAPDKDVDGRQQAVMVNPRVLEYETLVSLAQLKLHSTATVTLSLRTSPCRFRPRTTTATRGRSSTTRTASSTTCTRSSRPWPAASASG